jgi:hypothetical protein
MEKTIAQAMEERGEKRGQLLQAKATLRRRLEKRFGSLPEAIVQQITACEDLPRLDAADDRVEQMKSLDEFML